MEGLNKNRAYLSRKTNSCPEISRYVFVLTQAKTNLGRNDDNELTIDVENPAKAYAVISEIDNSWTITNKSNFNLHINGERLEQEKTAILNHEDEICLGNNSNLHLTYTFKIRNSILFDHSFNNKLHQLKKLEPEVLRINLENETVEKSPSRKLLKLDIDSFPLRGHENVKFTRKGEELGREFKKKADLLHNDSTFRKKITETENLYLTKENKALKQTVRDLQNEMKSKIAEINSQHEIKENVLEFTKKNLLNINADLIQKLRTVKDEIKLQKHHNSEIILREENLKIENKKLENVNNVLKEENLKLKKAIDERKVDNCHFSVETIKEWKRKLHELEGVIKQQQESLCQQNAINEVISSAIDNELQCSICSEVFINAVILSCSHTFCVSCINQWRRNNRDCPMCRNRILSMIPSLSLNNFICHYTTTLPIELQEKRKEAENMRK